MSKPTLPAELACCDTPAICNELCVGKEERGRVEVVIESPGVHGKQPARPPPAARGELDKDVSYAVSYGVARKENMALNGSVLVRADRMSVHGTRASVNQAARTCTVFFIKEKYIVSESSSCAPPKTLQKVWCGVNAQPPTTDILRYAVAPVTLIVRL